MQAWLDLEFAPAIFLRLERRGQASVDRPMGNSYVWLKECEASDFKMITQSQGEEELFSIA